MCDPNTTCGCGIAPVMPFYPESRADDASPSAPVQASVATEDAVYDPVTGFCLEGVTVSELYAPSVLSCGQTNFYTVGAGCSDSAVESCVHPDAETEDAPNASYPPLLSWTLLEELLRRPSDLVNREHNSPPPAQSMLRVTERPDGTIEVAGSYDQTVIEGVDALVDFDVTLSEIAAESDPAQRARLLEQAMTQLETFGRAAGAVQDVHTRSGLNEYQTIENWVHDLYDVRRDARPGDNMLFSESSTLPVASESVRLEGVMLGFNLAGINRMDHNYQRGTGTVVKFLLGHAAAEVAPEFGGRSLGTWGTNIAVSGIAESDLEAFQERVQERVIEYLGQETIPEAVSRLVHGMGPAESDPTGRTHEPVPEIRTADLEARDWLTRRPNRLGLTAGHFVTEIAMDDVRPGEVELRVIDTLEHMGEAEAEARRLDRPRYSGAVAEDSPVRGRAGRPLLRTEAILTGAPHEALPIEPGQYNETLNAEQIREGRLPNPVREASGSIFHYRTMMLALQSIHGMSVGGRIEEMQRGIESMHQYIENPIDSRGNMAEHSVSETLQSTYGESLQQHRFPGVYRLDFFPELARRTFNGERMFIQMAEYRDYWGHNRTHSPDAADSLHRLSLDILAEGYRYQGVEVLTGTNGGDEIFFAIRGRTADGHELNETDIERISEYLGTQFNRIFQNLEHHAVVKVPRAPGGIFEGRPYIIHEGRVLTEANVESSDVQARLLRTVEVAHRTELAAQGIEVESLDVRHVDNLSDVAQVERLRLWRGVDRSTGLTVDVLLPNTPEAIAGARARNLMPVDVPLETTITPAIEIPAGSSTELIDFAIERVGELADEMKRAGLDRPIPAETAQAARMHGMEAFSPIIDLGFIERFTRSESGRASLGLAANGGLFVFGELGSDLLLTACSGMVDGTCGEGSLERYVTLDGLGELGMTYGGMHFGAMGGERAMRHFMGVSPTARLTGMRGFGVRGAGMMGALLVLDAIHGNGEIDLERLGHSARLLGEAQLVVRGGTWVAGRALIGMGARRTGTWMAGAAMGARFAGPWGWVASGVLMVGEFAYMKYRSNQDLEAALAENVTDTRSELAGAIHSLNRIIEDGNFVDENGELNPEVQGRFESAMQVVNRQAGAYMTSLRIHQTSVGREYMAAYQELEVAREELHEHQGRSRHEFEGKYTNHYDGILANCRRRVSHAEEELAAVESRFNTVFERQIERQGVTTEGIPVLTDTSRDTVSGYRSVLSEDPVVFYGQYVNFLQSVGTRIDLSIMGPQLDGLLAEGSLAATGTDGSFP